MPIDAFLDPADVHVGFRAGSKERLLEELARHAGQSLSLPAGGILEALLARERLGSTGVGDGIALPHARMEGVRRTFALLATLKSPIDFQSVDDRPVDIVCLMLLPDSPAGERLGALAAMARKLRDPDITASLRRARGAPEAFALLVNAPASAASGQKAV